MPANLIRTDDEIEKLIEEIKRFFQQKYGFTPTKKELVKAALKKYLEELEK